MITTLYINLPILLVLLLFLVVGLGSYFLARWIMKLDFDDKEEAVVEFEFRVNWRAWLDVVYAHYVQLQKRLHQNHVVQ